ncbi:phosphatidate cytidylyltransferase [Fonticula alba]|uniref:Phosphatidate cytidylyltransferase n=1 Tax=Fonticula alba TaxID=691883 RepID=A0A058ZE14_FONAL|nr:phosphatidate cytidylyltransferase [Fonticula alba]KCV72640.1 phosphatidate cytidylyltransferase [Fonticula alba]|eukprot:XP_009492341.1 phosphatidate cytidylyltransferase [Fonticula alba]
MPPSSVKSSVRQAAASAQQAVAAAPGAAKATADPWYAPSNLARARVPIGFAIFLVAYILMYRTPVLLQIPCAVLLWWELGKEFTGRRGPVMLVCFTLLSLFDFAVLNGRGSGLCQVTTSVLSPVLRWLTPGMGGADPLATTAWWCSGTFPIWEYIGLRALLVAGIGLLAGLRTFDVLVVNYVLSGLTCVMWIMANYPVDVLLAISIIVAGSDGFQYFTGKTFGRTKIVPKISPNKSLEGYICAFFICIAMYYFYLADPSAVPIRQGLFYMVVMFLVGVFGDLFVSWWKRSHRIKDSSSFLGSHGGFLDRLDSHLAGWIWSAVYVSFLYTGSSKDFTGLSHQRIETMIVVVWGILLSHWAITRFMGWRRD